MKISGMEISGFDCLEIIMYGFFLFFFIIYIGKYGLTDLILTGGTKHEILFNIGVWFVLVMFCCNGLSDIFKRSSQKSTKARVKK